MKIETCHILITGGTDGIGLALARQLDKAGARVSVCGRSEDHLSKARKKLSETVCVVQCDVGDSKQYPRLLEHTTEANGPIDVLVNNAAVQQLMDFTDDTQPRSIATEIQVNLTAPLLLTEALLPSLRARSAAAIVNITSGLALSPKASSPVYCATKAGLRAFTRALRWQLEETNVRIIEILPPLVDTDMTAGRGSNKLSADQVAGHILRALRNDCSEVFIGKTQALRAVMAISPWLASKITRSM